MIRLPDLPRYMIDWTAVLHAAVLGLVALAMAAVFHRLVFALLTRIAARTETKVDDMVLARLRMPARWAAATIALGLAAQGDLYLARFWHAVAPFAVPAVLGWMVYSIVQAFAAALEYRADHAGDVIAARSHRTRIAILSRTATFVVVFITVGLMLLAIPVVRQVGLTLVASAGVAALFVGAAAQPALKSLIAGLQMAITEPLRIGDQVVIDGHTGRVEEIRMSFVILRMWDERLAIVPTSRFLDNTFENWSRSNEAMSGAVFLHLDPASEIAPIRAEFERYVAAHPLWDKRSARLMVTEARVGSIELRLALSAATIGNLFELRCAVREHMLDWLRREQPQALIHEGEAAR